MESIRADYEIRTARITVADMGDFLAKLRAIMHAEEVTIVCFNAENMAGIRHAEAALTHAIRSFSCGTPIAKTLEMEALLYAAGTRQCTEAAALGIHEGKNLAYVCCCPPRQGIWEMLSPLIHVTDSGEEVLDPGRATRLKYLFSITDAELTAAGGAHRLQDLVIERVALLDANR